MNIVDIPLLNSPWFWLLGIVGVIVTGISKSGFAGGAGVLAVPLLALVIPPADAVVLVLPLLLLMDVQTIARQRRNLDRAQLLALLPAALLGVGLGSALLDVLPAAALQWLLGLISITFAGLQWRALRRQPGMTPTTTAPPPRRGPALLAGVVAGTTSTLIHAGGPPLNMYLARCQLPKARWIGTAAVFFFSVNVVKVPAYAVLGLWRPDLLLLAALLIPAGWLGVQLGHRIQQRLSERQFVQVVLVALAGTGVLLIMKALGGA
ncbi:MAG: sulfite exporter TauE/SafE family protein [Oceanococcaceae bacterium]